MIENNGKWESQLERENLNFYDNVVNKFLIVFNVYRILSIIKFLFILVVFEFVGFIFIVLIKRKRFRVEWM